jgi:hypothetical protein
VTIYHIRFRARSIEPLPVDVAGRLTEAVAGTPSAQSIEVAVSDLAANTVESTFVIDVATDKMVDAARDGSRLAKESLWSAGVDAKLIELNVLRSGD